MGAQEVNNEKVFVEYIFVWAGAPIQVHAEQGVFEYNPEAKVFELTSLLE